MQIDETPLLQPAAPDPQELAARRERVRQALEHRFRHRLRTHQLCPLLHLLMRYKLESEK